MSPSPGVPKRYKRKRYILDRKWQFAVSRGVVCVALAAAVLYSLANYALAESDPIQRLSGRQLGLLALGINTAYFALLLGVLIFITMRCTHAVAGPAMVIEKAVEGMIDGDFGGRLTLRRRDYLKGLAATTKRLALRLEQRDSDQARLCAELEEALSRREHPAALELLQELRGLSASSPVDTSDVSEVAA